MSATTVYLGLGANLGDRQGNLVAALQRLPPEVRVEAVSSLYETAPVGPQDQPSFLNAVCRGLTELSPEELLRHIQGIERELGRRAVVRWGARLIDIDVLFYGDAVVDESGLRVPHPEMANRTFVLVPLAELAGDVRHPELGRTVRELAADVGSEGVRVQAGPGWESG